MSKTGEVGGENMDNFTQYSYAPSKPTGRDLSKTVFTVANGNLTDGAPYSTIPATSESFCIAFSKGI